MRKVLSGLSRLAILESPPLPEELARPVLAADKNLCAALGIASYADMQEAGDGGMSDFDFWAYLSSSIGQINEEFMKVYEEAARKNNDFFREFSDVLAEMGKYIDTGKENYVKLDGAALKKALQTVLDKHKNTVLYEAGSEAEALAWAQRLGLPDSCVEKVDGKWKVKLDTAPLQKMIDTMQSGEISTAKFQAWKAGFDAQEENLKNGMQTIMQKYSNAHSLYNNLVQVLSQSITAMLGTSKEFLKI